MKKLNIAKLLKDCPKGMELDCTMYDNVTFEGIKDVGYINILIKTPNGIFELSKNGCYHFHPNAKCVIFPKGKTTWEGFQRPFKDGDILYIDCNDNGDTNKLYQYIFILKEIIAGKIYCYCYINEANERKKFEICCLADQLYNPRFATLEEKEKLFEVIRDNGYRWNSETKELEKLPKFKVGDTITNGAVTSIIKQITKDSYILDIKDYDICFNYVFFKDQDKWKLIPNKFDISTLVPFESKVLVRTNNRKWVAAFYSHYDKDSLLKHCVVGGLWYEQCIPYNGNGHLLNTTNDCDEYYKTWE